MSESGYAKRDYCESGASCNNKLDSNISCSSIQTSTIMPPRLEPAPRAHYMNAPDHWAMRTSAEFSIGQAMAMSYASTSDTGVAYPYTSQLSHGLLLCITIQGLLYTRQLTVCIISTFSYISR